MNVSIKGVDDTISLSSACPQWRWRNHQQILPLFPLGHPTAGQRAGCWTRMAYASLLSLREGLLGSLVQSRMWILDSPKHSRHLSHRNKDLEAKLIKQHKSVWIFPWRIDQTKSYRTDLKKLRYNWTGQQRPNQSFPLQYNLFRLDHHPHQHRYPIQESQNRWKNQLQSHQVLRGNLASQIIIFEVPDAWSNQHRKPRGRTLHDIKTKQMMLFILYF